MILINGQLNSQLSVSDRGLQYGDGVWETLVYHHNHIPLFDAHMKRLERGLKALHLSLGVHEGLPVTSKTIFNEIHYLLKHSNVDLNQRWIIKLIISRGSGGRGYNANGLNKPTRIISLHAYPKWPEQWYQEGVNVTLCQTRLAHQPLLAGFKHLNRLEQVLARSEFDSEYQEGLVCDYDGYVIEGTMTNLFVIDQKNNMFTPSLLKCGIEGIARACILHHLKPTNSLNSQLIVKPITLSEVRQAKALFLCNSVIGLWPIRSFEDNPYPVPKLVYQLQSVLKNLI